MSLQLAAQHLASKGRGPDTTLVHMTPREVAGLQALAKAHGGSLTVNPHTGLPEAGFLSSILPMIAGIALGPAGFGLSAGTAGLLTGGATGLITGDLKKGLMAGLGAYGGAGLAGSIAGLGATGAEAISPTVGASAANAAPLTEAVATPVVSPNVVPQAIAPSEYSSFAPTSSQYGAFGEPPIAAPAPTTVTPPPANVDVNPKDMLLARGEVSSPAYVPEQTFQSKFTSGLKAAWDDPSKLMTKDNLKYGLAALAPMAMTEQKGTGVKGSGPNPYEYGYNYKTGQYTRLPMGTRDTYAQLPAYPMQRMADGGTVEDMSNRNAQEIFVANGGQMFADGGSTFDESTAPKYVYDPITKTYKDITKVQPITTTTQIPWSQMTPQQRLDAQNANMARLDNIGPGVGPEVLPNPDNMFTENGQLNPIAAGLAAIGNMMGIQNANQGALQAIPMAIATGSPFGIVMGGAAGNAVQGQNMLDLNNSMIQANGGIPIAGMPQPGQSGFVAALPGALAQQTSNASSQVNDEVNASLNAANQQAINDAIATSIEAANAGVGPGSSANTDVSSVDAVNGADAASDAAAAASADGGGGGGGGGDSDYAYGGLTALARKFSRGGYNLGDYSDGGRLLRGPGDGVSDSIPATIGHKRPARLADGEFVIPARIVSELGNGSTDAGARKLYAMMDRVQKNRGRTVGKGKVAVNSRSDKFLPA